jgi:hypothetical protein
MKYALALTLLFTSVLAHADEFGDFATSSLTIVETLRSQGVHNIGSLNLDELSQKIATTKWSPVNDKYLLGSGTDRGTSIYLVDQDKVFVNTLALKNLPADVFPQAALHEALGANGYEDENSQASLALDQLSKSPKAGRRFFEKQVENLKPTVKENKIYKTQSSAGGTSVGGGGDGTTIEFKRRLLQDVVDAFANSPNTDENKLNAILDQVLNMDVEPNWDFTRQTPPQIEKSPQGGLKLTIPSIYWVTYKSARETGENSKRQMLAPIVQYFLGSAP